MHVCVWVSLFSAILSVCTRAITLLSFWSCWFLVSVSTLERHDKEKKKQVEGGVSKDYRVWTATTRVKGKGVRNKEKHDIIVNCNQVINKRVIFMLHHMPCSKCLSFLRGGGTATGFRQVRSRRRLFPAVRPHWCTHTSLPSHPGACVYVCRPFLKPVLSLLLHSKLVCTL